MTWTFPSSRPDTQKPCLQAAKADHGRKTIAVNIPAATTESLKCIGAISRVGCKWTRLRRPCIKPVVVIRIARRAQFRSAFARLKTALGAQSRYTARRPKRARAITALGDMLHGAGNNDAAEASQAKWLRHRCRHASCV